MARTTTRRPVEDADEELTEDEAEEQEEVRPAAPAVSDSRRRRQMKRGEVAAVEEEESEEDLSQTARKDRPTPSQREVVKSSNVVIRFFQTIREYLKDTRSELSKVAWLTREDTLRLTYIVLIVTGVSAAVLGLISFLYGWLTTQLAQSATGLVAGAITIGMVIIVGGLWLFRDRLFGTHLE